MSDSIDDVSGGDTRKAQLLRATLQQPADGPDTVLKEMAESVLSGDVPLRDAAMSSAYGPRLGAAFSRFTTYYAELDETECEQLAAPAER
jgi:hypothetical protein